MQLFGETSGIIFWRSDRSLEAHFAIGEGYPHLPTKRKCFHQNLTGQALDQESKINRWLGWLLSSLILMFILSAQAAALASTTEPDPASKIQLIETYGRFPLSFEANQGQTDNQVKFISRGPGYNLFLTSTEAVLALRKPATDDENNLLQPLEKTTGEKEQPSADETVSSAVLRMWPVGANPNPQITGLEELPGKTNFFRGNDPKQWRTNIPTFAKVKYEEVYPGIDLLYYGNQRQLEYDFIVAPGADPETIRLAFEGAENLELDAQGDLVLHTAGGDVRFHKPLVYQEIDGKRREIIGRYVLHATNDEDKPQVSFQVAAYDKSKPLIIDPVLVYSTYLGGTGHDFGNSIAVDNEGNAYVTGHTGSLDDFPTEDPIQETCACTGAGDVFITKFNASGTALIYSTYLGGSSKDDGRSIVVDHTGSAYVTGTTASVNFPTHNPLQAANGGSTDAFVAKLTAAGNALVYSTYLGGSRRDDSHSLAVDAAGGAYITGTTLSDNFPTAVGAFDSSFNGPFLPGLFQGDAFVAKLDISGTTLVYSTYLGGSNREEGHGIAIDSNGNAHVTGYTESSDFPTENAVQPNLGGPVFSGGDAFITKLNAAGSELIYSTYLGGDSQDMGHGIAVGSTGNTYVTGETVSDNFPTVNPFQAFRGGGTRDAFVTKLDASGTTLLYSTYLGGSNDDRGRSIAVDAINNAYVVAGETFSTDFPLQNPFQDHNAGRRDIFVSKFDISGTTLVYSSYLGGSSDDVSNDDPHVGLAIDAVDSVYVTSTTQSIDFPIQNPFQDSHSGPFIGGLDAIVAKISSTVSLSNTSVAFGSQTLDSTSPPQTITVTNNSNGNLILGMLSITGDHFNDFALINDTCSGATLAPNASCTFEVTFTPTEAGERLAMISIPSNASDSPHTVALSGTGVIIVDTDGDGLPDDFEIANGLDPNDPGDAELDSDGDGLTNLQEFRDTKTDPTNRDTDGDGVDDGTEVAQGTDPLNENSSLPPTLLETPEQPVYDVIPPPITEPDKKRNLILIVHGWNSNPSTWASAMAAKIGTQIKHDPNVSWDIRTIDWSKESGDGCSPWCFIPKTAYTNAFLIGNNVGELLASRDYNHIHFIAHSAGSNVINRAANMIHLLAKEQPTIHSTFLDAYYPNEFTPPYGTNSDWAEQYVDKRKALGILNNTNLVLPHAFNFDVTRLDPDQSDNELIDDIIRKHAWPYCWYDAPLDSELLDSEVCDRRNTTVTNSSLYGFHLSLESGKEQLESHDDPLFVRGHECILFYEITGEVSECGENFPFSKPVLKIHANSTPPFNIWFPEENTFFISDTGNVDLSKFDVIKLSTDSPVWVSVSFNVEQSINMLLFDYRFLSAGQGLLSVFFDNQVVFKADERQPLANTLPMEPIPLGQIAPGTHTLSFRLDAFSDMQSVVEISNIRTGAMQVVRSTNRDPVASADPDQTVRLGSLVTLNGSASSDPDNGPSPLSFAWTQATGPTVTLTDATTATPTFTPPEAGTFAFNLLVNDGQDNSAPDGVTITVPILGDIDLDGDVDSNDLNLVLAARNTPADGPNDLRDINGDMKIDALDARGLTLLCTRPRCVTL